MYNLTEREISPPYTSTPAKVGPTTYFLDESKVLKKFSVPFLSNTERDFCISRKSYTDAIYNAEDPDRHIQGGNSFRNRAQRFVYKVDDTPSPTAYDPRCPKRGSKPIPRVVVGQGKLYNCRVPYSVQAMGKSIPTRIDANGYTIDENNALIKLPADENDISLGPAYYNLPDMDCFTTRRYHKGCNWSRSNTKRLTDEVSPYPGPGTYDVTVRPGSQLNQRDEEYRELARQFAFVPRYLDAQLTRMQREDLPAPGDYDVTSTHRRSDRKTAMSIKPRPFVTAAKRFNMATKNAEVDLPESSPGPDHYQIKYTTQKRQTFSTQKAPFRTLSTRFPLKPPAETPGPASYKITPPIDMMLLKNRPNPMVPFNKTAVRPLTQVARDAHLTPSSADYVVEPLEMEIKAIDTCHFKSKTERTKTRGKHDGAEPATYNISDPFNKNRNRTSHCTGNSPAAFQSSRPRGPLHPTTTNPGPADYMSQCELEGFRYPLNTTPRFRDEMETVGPGTYTLHPKYESSMYRASATDNLRLTEFVLRKDLRPPASQTWLLWSRELKKKKVMKWFHDYDMAQPKVLDFVKAGGIDDITI